MTRTVLCLKLVLLYLLWPLAAAYDLARDRTNEKAGWCVAVTAGSVIVFFLGEAVFVALPSLLRTSFIAVLSVFYLLLGNEFRMSAKEQSLWDF